MNYYWVSYLYIGNRVEKAWVEDIQSTLLIGIHPLHWQKDRLMEIRLLGWTKLDEYEVELAREIKGR